LFNKILILCNISDICNKVCNYIFIQKNSYFRSQYIIMGIHSLDNTDLHIIHLLQKDGRMTNLNLSTEIGLSPAPTLERVRKLENQEYIKGYHADVNEEALGFGIQCFIQITINLSIKNARNNFLEKIKDIENIKECYLVTGDSDFILKMVAKDMKDYERIVLDHLSKIEEIERQKSMMILSSTIKPFLPIYSTKGNKPKSK
jgi:Lrp/AsnC family leucine-responsive transcriptional regulator